MFKKFSVLVVAVFFSSSVLAQDNVSVVEPQLLVDVPTAGVAAKGSYDISLRTFAEGGLLGTVRVGLTDRLTFGASYGGQNIIGTGDVDWNPIPGVNVRYRMIDETLAVPAVTVGFESQGYGGFIDDISGALPGDDPEQVDRYTVKSRGFFAVASRNFAFMGNLGLHAGANWSVLEKEDDDNEPTFFFGIDKSLNDELFVVAEYDLALNDDDDIVGEGKGYLNVGARWVVAEQLSVEFNLKDLLENSQQNKFSREIRIVFHQNF